MANEFYTLIVVPHAKARFRKFQVSVRLTKWVLGSLGILALALVGILVHYTMMSVEVAEMSRDARGVGPFVVFRLVEADRVQLVQDGRRKEVHVNPALLRGGKQ